MITYKQAGVDIKAGDEVVRRLKKMVGTKIGGFGGLYPIGGGKYLVAATDGVGTKLKVVFKLGKHDTVGIDLVAMCANDVVAMGAKPLFFLDYIACHKIIPKDVEKVLRGVVKGCHLADCALIGGETAELSDMYKVGEYDLAGFCVGLVERGRVINGAKIKVGDQLIGLASSGLHSNGYTLARKVLFERLKLSPNRRINGFKKRIGDEVLTPTKIYVKPVLEVLKKFKIKGIAHITGGGLRENVGRILPAGTKATFNSDLWKVPPIFKFIEEKGKISPAEMLKVFNMGLGMVLVVGKEDAAKVLQLLKTKGQKASLVGVISKGNRQVVIL